jgi:23S rRNA (adenine2503-C2)-methyltransferase
LPKLEDFFVARSENKAKAKILYSLLYKDKIASFSEIDIFGLRTIKMLEEELSLDELVLLEKRESKDAAKLLFRLFDGNSIETVLMRHDYGNGLCVSTQAGCNMGCVFCESGINKKIRNLEAHEMVLQILYAEKALNTSVSHITLMGIGEPLDNYDNVMKFIDIIGCQRGLDIAARHVTISTCGLIPQIEMLKNRETHSNLALSLHAPNDEIRGALMPINKVYGVKKLMEAVKSYSLVKNKKTTIEYILLSGINDSDECAKELCGLLNGIKCYVNLIPCNETSLGFKRPEKERIDNFYRILLDNGKRATIRREFGSGLKAACGQLRGGFIDKLKYSGGEQ